MMSLKAGRIPAWPWIDCSSPWIPYTEGGAATRSHFHGNPGECTHHHCRDRRILVQQGPSGARCSVLVTDASEALVSIVKK